MIIGGFFGLLSTITLPILANPDEGYHLYGSYATFSNDDTIPNDILVNPFDILKTTDTGGYATFFTDRVNFEDDDFGVALNKSLPASDDGYINVPKFSSITDISHLPQALGILIGKMIYPSLGVMIMSGRIVNLIFYLAAVYLIIKKVKHAKWVFAFIALLPMMIHQAGSLSYDVVNIVVIFAFMALMINLYTQKTSISRNQTLLIAFLSIALLLTKPSNIIFLLFLPFLPKSLYDQTKFGKLAISNKKLLLTAGGVIAVAVLAIFVATATRYLGGHSVDAPNLIKVIIRTYTGSNPELDSRITTGIVGNFSWNYYRFPGWVAIINFVTLALLLLKSKIPKISRKFAIVSGSILAIYILALTVGMYFSWSLQPYVLGENAAYAKGLQGRYYTPLLVLLIPCAAYLQKYISVQAKKNVIAALVIGVSVFSLSYYLLITYKYFYL